MDKDVRSSKFQDLLKSLLPVDELYEKGRERARRSDTDTGLSEDIQVLEDFARAMALYVHTDPYDPAKNEQDQLREKRYHKQLKDCEHVEKALMDVALPKVREQEAKLAAKKKNLTEPKLSLVISVAAVLVISLSVAPTLHDRLFFYLQDPLLVWAISIIGAGAVATLITWSLVGAIDVTGKRSSTNAGGLIAGIGISMGTGILRLTDAQSSSEYIFAIALTLVEIFTIVFLEWHAIGLRSNYHEWKVYQEDITKATAELEAAQADLHRRQQELTAVNQALDNHVAHVEERWIRHNKIADLEMLAVKAVIDGYNQGIAENKGSKRNLVLVKGKDEL
jgi:hypothetical protein